MVDAEYLQGFLDGGVVMLSVLDPDRLIAPLTGDPDDCIRCTSERAACGFTSAFTRPGHAAV